MGARFLNNPEYLWLLLLSLGTLFVVWSILSGFFITILMILAVFYFGYLAYNWNDLKDSLTPKFDEFKRYLNLKDGTNIKSALVISADGNLSTLRELCKIKYLNNNLNHTIVTGYLECKKFKNSTAKQIFLKDNFIGLLPLNDKKNLINFVWSIDNKIFDKNKFDYHNQIIQMLNKFFLKEHICI